MTDRILFGTFPDGGAGLRISKPGKSAMANPAVPDDFIFDSDWFRTLPIHQTGNISVSPGATTVMFPELTFPPMALVYFWDNNGGLASGNVLRMINADVPHIDDDPLGTVDLYRKNFRILSFVDRLTFNVGVAWPTKAVTYCIVRIPMR